MYGRYLTFDELVVSLILYYTDMPRLQTCQLLSTSDMLTSLHYDYCSIPSPSPALNKLDTSQPQSHQSCFQKVGSAQAVGSGVAVT